MWRARDRLVFSKQDSGQPPTEPLATDLQTLPASKTNGLNGTTWFYPGCPCTFLDNAEPGVGRTKNSFGYMQRLVLDPREPAPDDPASATRWLKYVPLAVQVSIPQPSGSASVVPVAATSVTCSVHLPHEVKLPDGSTFITRASKTKDQPAQLLKFRRLQVPLGDGFAVTDFFTQVRYLA
jgi:hypothetical protein